MSHREEKKITRRSHVCLFAAIEHLYSGFLILLV